VSGTGRLFAARHRPDKAALRVISAPAAWSRARRVSRGNAATGRECSTPTRGHLHPTVMVDEAQPNLLDPAGDGNRALDRIRAASR
jgi:hypothetical protein